MASMKSIFLICAVILSFSGMPAAAWDNPHREAAPFIKIPADRPAKIRLENRRVQNINGDTFSYKTNGRTVTIKADSAAARRFVQDVRAGRRSAAAAVVLTPVRQSPFNSEYKAR
jgi:hypothetical protein